MSLARTRSNIFLGSLALTVTTAMLATAPAAASGAITWAERAVDPEGATVRALGTDADGGAVRLIAARAATDGIDQTTFVFLEGGRQLVIERVAGPQGVSLSARSGRDRLVLELQTDPLRHGSVLRYTLPDGGTLEYQVGARGQVTGDGPALRRAFDRYRALVDQMASFAAVVEDPEIGVLFGRGGISSPRLESGGKFGAYNRCLDECANECGAQCAAECNLGILDPFGMVCGLCKTSCLAGCSVGCSRMWTRE